MSLGSHLIDQPRVTAYISIAALLSIFFGHYLFHRFRGIKVAPPAEGATAGARLETALLNKVNEVIKIVLNLFLGLQFGACIIFALLFGTVIIILVSYVGNAGLDNGAVNSNGFRFDRGGFTSIAFGVAVLVSIFSASVSSHIAVYAQSRAIVSAEQQDEAGWRSSFGVAFNAGASGVFKLLGLAIIFLYFVAALFGYHFDATTQVNSNFLFSTVTGYGLGAAAVALFVRVSGGIFGSAASLGASLVGKAADGIPEEHPSSPASIIKLIGETLNNVTGFSTDIFASFAEASVAALYLGSLSGELTETWAPQVFPLVIAATGVYIGIFTHFISADVWPVASSNDAYRAIKVQALVATALGTAAIWPIIAGFMPNSFHLGVYHGDHTKLFFSIAVGLWAGYATAVVSQYYTSPFAYPLSTLAKGTDQGGIVASLLGGLSLGSFSIVIPFFFLTAAVYVSFHLIGAYGVSLAALGYLISQSTVASLGFFGPIAESAATLARLAHFPHAVTSKTEALAFAGSNALALAKAYSIGSSVLVTLALIGAYSERSLYFIVVVRGFSPSVFCGGGVDILQPMAFASLISGAMIPYWFNALTTQSITSTALLLVKEVARQFRELGLGGEGGGEADHKGAGKLTATGALKGALLPAFLVLFAPLFVGILFGVTSVVGLLSGALVSGIALALSTANTGSAWDAAKRFVDTGALVFKREGQDVAVARGSEAYNVATLSGVLGQPLKDTAGPGASVAVQVMAIVALVFADFFGSIRNGGGAFHIVPSCNIP